MADAVFGIEDATKDVVLFVSDRTGLCALLGGNLSPSGNTILGAVLLNYSAAPLTSALAPGDYAWFDAFSGTPPSGMWWDGVFALPSSCSSFNARSATAGTMTVVEVGTKSGAHLRITLDDVAFGSDTLAGSVEAVYCPAAKLAPNCGTPLAPQ
ncbi:MAG: hypothetical protein ACXWK8_08055 [Myxococcaceae bacterium]